MSFQRISSATPTPPPKGAFLSGDGKRLLAQYALSWGAVLLSFFLRRKLRTVWKGKNSKRIVAPKAKIKYNKR